MTSLVDQGKSGDVVGLDFSKAFDAVSQGNLLDKMFSTQLGKSKIWWVNNCLTSQAQNVLVSRIMSDWQWAPSGSISGLVLLNVFINDLDAGIECTLSEYSNDTKAGEAVDSSGRRKRPYKKIWRDLESWPITNHKKFNKDKGRILYPRV